MSITQAISNLREEISHSPFPPLVPPPQWVFTEGDDIDSGYPTPPPFADTGFLAKRARGNMPNASTSLPNVPGTPVEQILPPISNGETPLCSPLSPELDLSSYHSSKLSKIEKTGNGVVPNGPSLGSIFEGFSSAITTTNPPSPRGTPTLENRRTLVPVSPKKPTSSSRLLFQDMLLIRQKRSFQEANKMIKEEDTKNVCKRENDALEKLSKCTLS